MAFELPVPAALRNQRWRVKIRDRERLEPPHVTILRRTQAWRINLRTGAFMDDEPPPRLVPSELMEAIEAAWDELVEAWDSMYPHNPVKSPEEDAQ